MFGVLLFAILVVLRGKRSLWRGDDHALHALDLNGTGDSARMASGIGGGGQTGSVFTLGIQVG